MKFVWLLGWLCIVGSGVIGASGVVEESGAVEEIREIREIRNRGVKEEFNEFMVRYGKNYGSWSEYQYRFNVFVENMNKINSSNSKTHGITKFSDLTKDEFSRYPCGGYLSRFNFTTHSHKLPDKLTNKSAPSEWDWTEYGAVTPVKDQGECGSCWAFSVIGNIEGVWSVSKHRLVNLSESEFVDCSGHNFGCGGGWPHVAMEDILKRFNGSVDTEDAYPYSDKDQPCIFTEEGIGANFSDYLPFCTLDTKPCDEDQMKVWLYQYGPLSVCLNADSMQSYVSGVDMPSDCSSEDINHCVTLVGYGVSESNLSYWRMKNSWGTNWGEHGYYRLLRGQGVCGINLAVTTILI